MRTLLISLFVALSGFFGWQSQKDGELSETALANIEALSNLRDPIPDKCKGCSINEGEECCIIYFDGWYVVLKKDDGSNPSNPTE